MKFLQAKNEYVNGILSILNDASAFLREQGIDQWQGAGAPTEAEVIQSVQAGTQYLLQENGEVVAVCTVLSHEPAYMKIDGAWKGNGAYLAVHRVAVARFARGRGLTKRLYEGVEQLARARGVRYIRVDTHRDNLIMQRVFASNGFYLCGVVHYREDGSMERLAYEKEIQ